MVQHEEVRFRGGKMKKLRCTVTDVISWEPCGLHYPAEGPYNEKYIREMFGRRKYLTALEILWVVLREEMIPAPILHEFACWCAEWALKRERKAGREPDKRSWDAIRVKRAWLCGAATNEELAEAEAEAEAAEALAEARAAAVAAALAAAPALEEDPAAMAAIWAARAARATVEDADAARDAANRTFCRKLIRMLEGTGGLDPSPPRGRN